MEGACQGGVPVHARAEGVLGDIQQGLEGWSPCAVIPLFCSGV